MGRYYNGDIEGKFWFGVQDSTDASFFGGTGGEPTEIEYSFEAEMDMEGVKEGIKKCLEALGEYKQKLDAFFSANNGYHDKMLAQHLGVEEEKVWTLLEWYARLELGEKIKKCLEEKESCYFTAEL